MTRKCDCSWCDTSEHKDFHGYRPEDEEGTPYRKAGGRKGCKRSKDGEHDWTGEAYRWTYKTYYDSEVKRWRYKNVYGKVVVCARCHKEKNRLW
jgi:hypothetical protein